MFVKGHKSAEVQTDSSTIYCLRISQEYYKEKFQQYWKD